MVLRLRTARCSSHFQGSEPRGYVDQLWMSDIKESQDCLYGCQNCHGALLRCMGDGYERHSLAHRAGRAAQVKCLQRADEDAFLDRVNMYSSFYVAIRKA